MTHDYPAFPFHSPEIAKELQERLDELNKLDPWSLFLYARARMLDKCCEDSCDINEACRILSVDPEHAMRIVTRDRSIGTVISKLPTDIPVVKD